MTKHWSQTPICQSVCLEVIKHLEILADSPDKTIQ